MSGGCEGCSVPAHLKGGLGLKKSCFPRGRGGASQVLTPKRAGWATSATLAHIFRMEVLPLPLYLLTDPENIPEISYSIYSHMQPLSL